MAIKFNPKEGDNPGKGADTELQQLAKTDRNPIQETRYQELLRQQGSTSPSATSSAAPGSYSTGGTFPGTANLGNQGKAASDFSTAFNNFVQGQPNYQDLWKNIAGTFNYPQLATTATNLNNQVAMIPQTEMGITRGFDVSSPQLQNMMNMQYWKLSPLAQRATAQAQTAGQLTGEQLAAARAQQMKELMPWQTSAQTLNAILGNLTNILGQQIGQQYKMTPRGQLISTGAVPGTTGGTLGPYASEYYGSWTPFR